MFQEGGGWGRQECGDGEERAEESMAELPSAVCSYFCFISGFCCFSVYFTFMNFHQIRHRFHNKLNAWLSIFFRFDHARKMQESDSEYGRLFSLSISSTLWAYLEQTHVFQTRRGQEEDWWNGEGDCGVEGKDGAPAPVVSYPIFREVDIRQPVTCWIHICNIRQLNSTRNYVLRIVILNRASFSPNIWII